MQKHLIIAQSSNNHKKMDEKDKLILFELLQDCRQPLSKISKAVKLPQQTISYRINKLEKSKIIKKYII